MDFKNKFKTLIFSAIALCTLAIPSAFALDFEASTTTSDESQGDVTEDLCGDLESGLGSSLGCDGDDEITDFTEYVGGLEAPDATGYAENLTKATNLRDLVQTIVNFALSFLGLAATVMMIYGGVLYVMSRGEEGEVEKGKKTMTYSLIGIVIILSSFAIVNTVINITSTDDARNLSGGGSSSSISESGESFDVDSVLKEITSISQQYIKNYQTYAYVNGEVDYMRSIEMPLIVDVTETDVSVGGFFDYLGGLLSGTDSSYPDEYSLIEEDDVDEYIDKLRKEISKIQSKVDSLSNTYEVSQSLYNYLRSGTSTSAIHLNEIVSNLIPEANADYESTEGCAGRDYEDNYTGELSDGFGWTAYSTDVRALDDDICSFIDAIEQAARDDFTENTQELEYRLNTLRALFDTDESEGSSLEEITFLFDTAILPLVQKNDPDEVASSVVRDLIGYLDTLYTAVQNIEFVKARITASVKKGNAPLIVRFDVLESSDPSNQTITDERVNWDLDGDGDFDDGTGDTTSYKYEEPGSYRVGVKIVSSDSGIAAGISFLTIKVEPQSAIIKLSASTGGEVTELADYSKFPILDKKDYRVTLTEAAAGITFDASGSTDGEKNPLIYYSWEWGDGEVTEGENESTVTHAYGKSGRFQMVLTVTDSLGVQDRKIVNIYVGSPAARISYGPSYGQIGTKFSFSGAGSTTDVGTIISYQWAATANGVTYALDEDNGVQIDAVFDEPGIYTLTLTVSDSSNNKDIAEVEILVESQTPVARYEYSAPNPSEPGTYVFDASDSSDPDPTDTLSYEWLIEGDEGQDYEILDYEENGKIMTVQFLMKGVRDVTLTVKDSHETELQKTDTATGEINVESVLDVALDFEDGSAYKLDANGDSEVTFIAESSVAESFEIDYGDGENGFSASISNGSENFTHTYDKAGIYYVKLVAYDADNVSNSIIKRLYISSGDDPTAIINVLADGVNLGFGETITGNTKTVFTFDASESINTDGSVSGLTYSWNFGDGSISDQKKVTHTFDGLNTYTVELTVKDHDDTSLTSTSSLQIKIEGIKPRIKGLSVTPQGDSLETPLKVNVTVDASDEDGKITYVKAWYYDIDDSAEELGTIISQSTSFTLTVNTKGEEGDSHTYAFAVELTDDDNNTVASLNELGGKNAPTLTVTNGPNDSPQAGFSVDRTAVKVGDEINFYSSSIDPDGKILYYTWDVEGNGFHDNEEQSESSYTYEYKEVHPDGIEVQLKVEDDAGATSVSDPITIYITSDTKAPEAAFLTYVSGTKVTFENNSDIDTENGVELGGLFWDFDTTIDSDGNGKPDDDTQAIDEENPAHEYGKVGTYSVKMTVADSTGQTDTVIQDVLVKEAADPVAAFTFTTEGMEVSFRNNSSTDTENDVGIRAYVWDFDTDIDSDGDGDKDNDVDSKEKNPIIEYEDYGSYEVVLQVTDELGQVDEVAQIVQLSSVVSDITALLTSSPKPNSKGQISIEGSNGDVTFYFDAEGGSDKYNFYIDKNVFYDTKGDGIRDNDVDYSATNSGSWKTNFDKSYGQIVVKLSAVDDETGETSIATLQVVFTSSTGANLFNARPNDMIFFIISSLLAAIVGVVVCSRQSYKVHKK